MSTSTHYSLTERDVYYLKSISRMVGEVEPAKVGDPVTTEDLVHLKTVLARLDAARHVVERPSLANEVLSDNHDRLDWLIDMVERS